MALGARSTMLVAAIVATLVAGSAAADTASNRTAAQADVQTLLAALRVPGTPTATEPAGDDGLLANPAMAPPPPVNLAQASRWWVTTLPPASDIASVVQQLPASVTASPIAPDDNDGFTATLTWPPVPGVLSARTVVLTDAPLADGRAALRADAYSVYLTTRSPSEHASATATGLTVRPTSRPSYRIAARARVRAAVALFNRLPVVQPEDIYSCPAERGTALHVTFSAAGGAPPVVAVVHTDGCPFVDVTVGGQLQPELIDTLGLAKALAAPHR